MTNDLVQQNSTNISVEIRAFVTATGAPKTDVTNSTPGLAFRYRIGATGATTTFAPASLATEATAHTDGGIIHTHAGVCRLDVPDAVATGDIGERVTITAVATDTTFTVATLKIVDYNAAEDNTQAIADAVNEGALDIIETYNRTSNTAATMGGRSLTIATDDTYKPFKSIT